MTNNTHVDETTILQTTTQFKKILVATDFSPCSNGALEYALAIARVSGASLQLMHVIGSVEGDAWSPLRYIPETHATGETPDTLVQEFLDKEMNRVDTTGLTTDTVRLHGNPARMLVRYAVDEGMDLIVLGTFGRSGLQRMVIGSTALKVIQNAPCSVIAVNADWIASKGDLKNFKIDRILVPVDLSDFSRGLIRAAGDLAEAYSADVDVIHVVESLPYLNALAGIMTAGDLVPTLSKRAATDIREIWNEYGTDSITPKMVVKEGHSAGSVVDYARETDADMIVISPHGRSGASRFLLGSTTERVVRTAHNPVLVYRQIKRDG
ncbi:MAG: universal stress protein [Rhodothermales bacterium]|nr:universal stress protein [Rhodothermales bacterium]